MKHGYPWKKDRCELNNLEKNTLNKIYLPDIIKKQEYMKGDII